MLRTFHRRAALTVAHYGAAVVPAPGPVVTGSPESIFHTVATPSPGVKPLPANPVDDSFASVSATAPSGRSAASKPSANAASKPSPCKPPTADRSLAKPLAIRRG